MRPFWAPQSALIVPDPPALATRAVLRLMLRAGRPIELVYAGDRMWPALRHGQRVVLEPILAGEGPCPGSVVLACPSGIPDLLRVESVGDSTAVLLGDSDPIGAFEVPFESILARARTPARRVTRIGRSAMRLLVDLDEALRRRPDHEDDPAGTVRSKYDAQAPFYANAGGEDMEAGLLAWFKERVAPGGRVLVAGSGSGRECFALAAGGYDVRGVDFSPLMVEVARKEARRRSLSVSFELADLRAHEEAPSSIAAVYFTYVAYSFIPERSERIDLLRRMALWLAPGGLVFLAARRFERLYDPFLLTLQRAARLTQKKARWGQSHTRWITPDGSLHRSFIQIFAERAIRREAVEGGFLAEPWRGSHCVLVPAADRPAPL